ncbi:hypothetical protein N7520_000443 [Penicillium odoratum]|uniref:uncharacterized protein n=1 Tax=Penicillium odoratum TaxID=1167516 RepID=UPI002548837D|nr:uncharacterized protein N7520_000443 [Penicillium odoratum]KAJ5777197.1 hypothetical protein N7520_000443 [Penicillium odoratum]
MAKWVEDQWKELFEIPTKYNADDCNDALHGSRVPECLDEPCQRLCTELRGVTPEFTRALNARDIMSGIIPTISQPEETPYCIWYPEVPKEDTLRALVQRYPDMLYHAARACAVAGYFDLDQELDPLPEAHVAEEAGYASAQRSNNGSQQIHQHTLSPPVKFAIMNDYTRTVDVAGCRVASLNGDTAVYSRKPWTMFGDELHYFNITEDWGIGDHDCEAPETPDDYLPRVYNPLPQSSRSSTRTNLSRPGCRFIPTPALSSLKIFDCTYQLLNYTTEEPYGKNLISACPYNAEETDYLEFYWAAKDKLGFLNDPEETTGISADQLVWDDYGTLCSLSTIDKTVRQCSGSINKGKPSLPDGFTVSNPKDIISARLQNITTFQSQSDDLVSLTANNLYIGNTIEIVDGATMLVLMVPSSITSMKSV